MRFWVFFFFFFGLFLFVFMSLYQVFPSYTDFMEKLGKIPNKNLDNMQPSFYLEFSCKKIFKKLKFKNNN